jgi:toxin ParE1/3/4
MALFRLSRAAENDILEILAWSQTHFGIEARIKYEELIAAALRDIAASPHRVGSVTRPELGTNARTWHLRASRDAAVSPKRRVNRPRHFLVYREVDSETILVARVLHDAMELERHMENEDVWS